MRSLQHGTEDLFETLLHQEPQFEPSIGRDPYEGSSDAEYSACADLSIHGTGPWVPVIHLASESIRRQLQRGYSAQFGAAAASGITFSLEIPPEGAQASHAALYLFKISVDASRRRQNLPPVALFRPARSALCLDLRYLLVTSAANPATAQELLAQCIGILDARAIISGDALARPDGWVNGGETPDPWLPDAALKVAIDDLPQEDIFRLWDAMDVKFRPCVPYVVRSVFIINEAIEEGTTLPVNQSVIVGAPFQEGTR